MTGKLAAGAFSREARMILRLIAKPDTRLVEDRRDEMRFDQLLDHLEQAAIALRAASGINRHD